MKRDVSRKQLASTTRRSLSPLLPKEKLDRLDAAITKGADRGQVVKIYAVGPKLVEAGATRLGSNGAPPGNDKSGHSKADRTLKTESESCSAQTTSSSIATPRI